MSDNKNWLDEHVIVGHIGPTTKREQVAADRAAATVEICQWWFLCDNKATQTQSHPTLGDVPICDRCKAKYDRLKGEI